MATTTASESETSTGFQSESYSTKSIITSVPIISDAMTPYIVSLIVVGILGILANGFVLGGFCFSDRSNMTSTMFHIANQTTLQLVACVMIVTSIILEMAGRYKYGDSSPSAMAMCVLLEGATLFTLGLNGSTASLVIMTFDRYWKIVHAVNHRNHYRRWMLYVGLFLPWLNGIAVHLLPSLGTSRIINGNCITLAFWPSKVMAQGYGVFMYVWQFFIPLIIFIFAYWKILRVVSRQSKISGGNHVGIVTKKPVAGPSKEPNEQADAATKNVHARQVTPSVPKRQGLVGNQPGPKKLSATQINVVKTMIYITGCFTLCWMPMYMFVFLSRFNVTSLKFDNAVGVLVRLAAYCNIFLNPLIYISRYEVVKRSLTGCFRKVAAAVNQQSASTGATPT